MLLGALPESQVALSEAGFEFCIDVPQRPDHQYMEGYYHALHRAGAGTVKSCHPRYGKKLERQAAPAPMRAFCEAFRRANAAVFGELHAELAASSGGKALADVLRREAHFADLSVQVHWGEEVPSQDVGWHVDGANSFLHMALGLQGQRALHARRRLVRRGQADDEPEVLWQSEGDAYVSVPCAYAHAVEYPQVTWQNRIVAVQCRLLLTEDEFFGVEQLDNDPRGGTAAMVYARLARLSKEPSGELVMPDVDAIRAVLAEMPA